jgi:hypothetical protein
MRPTSLLTLAVICATFFWGLVAAGISAWHRDYHWALSWLAISYGAALTARIRTVEARQDRVDHVTGAWRRPEP